MFFQICQVLMLVSTGERAMLPYWIHQCVSDAGINHRRMYSTAVPLEPPKHEMTCAACLDHEKMIAFSPCGYVICARCGERLNRCTLCRTDVIEKIKKTHNPRGLIVADIQRTLSSGVHFLVIWCTLSRNV